VVANSILEKQREIDIRAELSGRQTEEEPAPSTRRSASRVAAPKNGTPKSVNRPRELQSLLPLELAPSSKLHDLIDVVQPDATRHDVVLDAGNVRVFVELLEEFRRGDTLRRHGLPIRQRLLFCGPPGCGKTLSAEAFANELGLNLFIIRLDAVVSSFLGETASNLRTVIEAAERRPCVLFFDEFDALARARTDPNEHGEIRRVVNSLLMLFDRFKGRGFLIASTNLEASLDNALWRRFDDVVMFEAPSVARIRKMLSLKTKNFAAAFDIHAYAKDLEGFSYAEIERICIGGAKKAVMARRKRIAEQDFLAALKEERRRQDIRKRASASSRNV
jgi:SpoVK/Ycf46/Vps4 family AAA+-type ATPase